jgi:acylglycerol lipase
VVVHGFSDHIGRYYGLFPALAGRGIAVYGFDQRGWGRSVAKPAEKGLTGPTSQVLADIAAFITALLDTKDSVPVFVMGHSMGGADILTLACDPAYEDSIVARVRGWICDAPFICFAPEGTPSALVIFLGRLVGRILPHHHLVHKVTPEHISRDPEVVKSVREDKLCHDTGTLEGISNLLDRTTALMEGKMRAGPKFKALWIGHGTEDKVTSFQGSKKWYDECTAEIKDKTFKAYEGMYHQLHADYGKEAFYQDIGDWILARCET